MLVSHTVPDFWPCKTLTKDRHEASFEQFWELTIQNKEQYNIDDAVLPRKRKTPARFEPGSESSHHFPDTPKDQYKRMYFEACNQCYFVINAIKKKV